MPDKQNADKKNQSVKDGSEKKRPDSEKDFKGIERAQKSEYKPATEVTNEWEAREDESSSP
jgi:hypothetical protein